MKSRCSVIGDRSRPTKRGISSIQRRRSRYRNIEGSRSLRVTWILRVPRCMPRIKVLSTSSQQTCEESPQLFPHKVVSREGEIVRWKWVYVSDMRETFLGNVHHGGGGGESIGDVGRAKFFQLEFFEKSKNPFF